jgi:hypothetical protein
VPLGFIGAAVTAETARWVSRWADGLLTEGGALEIVRRLIVPRWPSLSDSNPKPTLLQIGLWVLDNDRGPIGGWSGRRRMAALLVSLITTATLVQLVMKDYANWLDWRAACRYLFPNAHRKTGRRSRWHAAASLPYALSCLPKSSRRWSGGNGPPPLPLAWSAGGGLSSCWQQGPPNPR